MGYCPYCGKPTRKTSYGSDTCMSCRNDLVETGKRKWGSASHCRVCGTTTTHGDLCHECWRKEQGLS